MGSGLYGGRASYIFETKGNGMKAFLEDGNPILFLCDRKACGPTCPNQYCTHTSDIQHAANFDWIAVNTDNLIDWVEVDRDIRAEA